MLGGGQLSLGMSFVGLGWATMIVLTRSKPFLGEKSLRSLLRKSKWAPSPRHHLLDNLGLN